MNKLSTAERVSVISALVEGNSINSLTNGFSKKIENHGHMTTIFMTYYNWCRRHQSLGKCTPAMAAGLTDHKWELAELVEIDGLNFKLYHYQLNHEERKGGIRSVVSSADHALRRA